VSTAQASDELVSDVVLNIGEFFFGGGRTRVRTLLGSCVAITMWHPSLRIGGMCHYLLPMNGSQHPSSQAHAMSAQGALRRFMDSIKAHGTKPADYQVKMFGGGYMFASRGSEAACAEPCDKDRPRSYMDVSYKNVTIGRELLRANGFRILAENVGGVGSRQLILELWSGDVWVRKGRALLDGVRS
jgi:chemotaxis protein CheD